LELKLDHVSLFLLHLTLNLKIRSKLILFAFRPLPAIALAQARQAGLSGKQKYTDLSGLCVFAVNYSE
jgi:hypothetical protein